MPPHFRNKKREYLEGEVNELETCNNSKNMRHLCRDINDFMNVYKARTNLVKDGKGDLLVGFHSILRRWKLFCMYVCQLGLSH
jgi:hypothetical protein